MLERDFQVSHSGVLSLRGSRQIVEDEVNLELELATIYLLPRQSSIWNGKKRDSRTFTTLQRNKRVCVCVCVCVCVREREREREVWVWWWGMLNVCIVSSLAPSLPDLFI